MSRIKIKNFGPIKNGYEADGGFMDIKKVTVFIGNQGSGKSTVAKAFSTLSWMEKALNRKEIEEPKSINDFQQYFKYQGISAYFKDDTTIEYYGDAYSILYNSEESRYTITTKNTSGKYIVPKLSYVPAERNFLSVIKNATGVKGLPEALFDFAEQLKIMQNELKEAPVLLPINEVSYKYDHETDSSFIVGAGFNVNLLIASSGFQSLVPLYLVSSALAKKVVNSSELDSSSLSVDQVILIGNEVVRVMNDPSLTDAEKVKLSAEIRQSFINKCFINIVEEPEQNLFPSSQQKLLNSLLEFNNMSNGNKLIMTTHSPYLINYLTLAVKAAALKEKVRDNENLKRKLESIVPFVSTINANDLGIYELYEQEGVIRKLKQYNGLPSDENELNEKLEESNELFARLLEIQQAL
jgi:predicted ATPase